MFIENKIFQDKIENVVRGILSRINLEYLRTYKENGFFSLSTEINSDIYLSPDSYCVVLHKLHHELPLAITINFISDENIKFVGAMTQVIETQELGIDIYINNLFNQKGNYLENLESVLIHEVRHLFDHVNSKNLLGLEDSKEEYLNKRYEINARIAQWVNKHKEEFDFKSNSLNDLIANFKTSDLIKYSSLSDKAKRYAVNRVSKIIHDYNEK